MRAHLILGNVRIRGSGVEVFDVLLGDPAFTVKLLEAPVGVQWFAENDPVLAIVTSADGKSAEITATGVGTSIIHLETERGGRPVLLKKLVITVFEDTQTATVGMTFGNVRGVEQP